jgi:hypothetical protein
MVLLAVALAAVPAWLSVRSISANRALRSWTKSEAVVTSLAADNWVEVQMDGPDGPRFHAPTDHHVGLSFLKHVPVYVNPADPSQVRLGGLLQMWLFPGALAFASVVLLFLGAVASRVGQDSDEAAQGWMFSARPAPLVTDIRVYRPSSEWKMPLVWSLLGIAALGCGLFIRSAALVPKLTLSSLGIAFILAMWALSIDAKTTEVSADRTALRKTTAFGWREVRWEEVSSVQEQETIFGPEPQWLRRPQASFRQSTKSIIFADKRGRTLIRMSNVMVPEKSVARLLDLCADRTGLHLEFRKVYEPNL